jgi:hypothetical protein
LFAASGCGNDTVEVVAGAERQFSGVLSVEFESLSFKPDRTGEDWWVRASPAIWEAINDAARFEPADRGFSLRVEVLGTPTERRPSGHLGGYDREIEITRVLRAAPIPAL